MTRLIYLLIMIFLCFRACYGVLRYIMESGAKGCEVVVSGKLRGQRAKSMKFSDGLMIHSGEPRRHYVNTAVCHVPLRQGKSYFLFNYIVAFASEFMLLEVILCSGSKKLLYAVMHAGILLPREMELV